MANGAHGDTEVVVGRKSSLEGPSTAPGGNGRFNGVKVISATMMADRHQVGEKVTAWIAAHPQCEVTDIVVTQSSDDAFHCISFSIFYWQEPSRGRCGAGGA